MVTDPGRDLAHLLDHSKIERAAPHEGLDRVEELPAERKVAGRGASTDEGGAFPWQGARFVMGNGSVHRQRDGGDLGRGAQAQVNPLDVAVLGSLLEKLNNPSPNSDGRFTGVVPRSARQPLRIEQQQQVDIGGIVELVAAKLAHRDHRKTLRIGVRHPLGDRGVDRLVDGAIGEVRKQLRHLLQRKLAG